MSFRLFLLHIVTQICQKRIRPQEKVLFHPDFSLGSQNGIAVAFQFDFLHVLQFILFRLSEEVVYGDAGAVIFNLEIVTVDQQKYAQQHNAAAST